MSFAWHFNPFTGNLDKIDTPASAFEVQKAGSATLVSSKTAAVNFVGEGLDNEADTSYQIILTSDSDENFYWSAKATTGFTINSSWSSSIAVVDWIVIR